MKPSTARLWSAPACLAGLLLVAPAWAQYKVVSPDGSVTYTDRPPVAQTNLRITPFGRNAPPGPAPEIGLPLELRQVTQRYPVTLYTTADCPPCDSGRKLLQARGVPYSERRVATEDDAAALDRLVGGRSLPALTVGVQPLRGFSESDWSGYLDAAGYPKDSKLPRNWPVPTATPLVERTAPATTTPGPRQAAAPAEPAPAPLPPPPRPGTPQF